MRIYILGICGTFMASLATLARDLGHTVAGTDQNIYPPMSDVLSNAKIALDEGYSFEAVKKFKPDIVIIGNALSRGHPIIEAVLQHRIAYTSGPQWLAENLLHNRHVLAVSGTHGKTTVASILTWLLAHAGLQPGFLIGGVPNNFNKSAALGNDPYFVIEADEYDTAFFDKRPKFMHYRPQTCIVNNIEFDHGDIYADLAAIKTQFGYLLRTVPNNGVIIAPKQDENIAEVVKQGCWSKVSWLGDANAEWRAEPLANDCHRFLIYRNDKNLAEITWGQCGRHNMLNALAAFVAAFLLNIAVDQLQSGLNTFQGVKKRLEVRGSVNDITVYDDFAHHPTAIAAALDAVKNHNKAGRVFAITEFGSNTMKSGQHLDKLPAAFAAADAVYFYQPPSLNCDINAIADKVTKPCFVGVDIDDIVSEVIKDARPGDSLLVMSNKNFSGIHQKLLAALGG